MKRVIFMVSLLFFALIFSITNAATVRVVEIKKITTGGKYSAPQWSPDGTKIYASGDRGSLVAMNSDGSNVTTLIEGDGFARKFAISPDGTKILYEYKDAVWIMNSDGSGKKELAPPRACDPLWSKDGKFLAYSCKGGWIANADGSNQRYIARGIIEAFLDNKVLFSAFRQNAFYLYSIGINQQNESLLLKASIDNLRVSPDGSKIYYTNGGTFSFDLQTKTKIELGRNISSIDLSNDGKRIAYNYRLEDGHSAETLVSDIWIMNSDGTEKVQVTNTPDVHEKSPQWSPDGGKIIFCDEDGELYIATLEFQ